MFPTQGYAVDLQTFEYWVKIAADNGLGVFCSVVGWSDYPPFNVYLFLGVDSLATELSLFGKLLVVYLINLLPNLFDIATSFLIFAARGNAITLMMHRSSPAKINNNESAILPAIFKHHKKLVHGSVTGSPRLFPTFLNPHVLEPGRYNSSLRLW